MYITSGQGYAFLYCLFLGIICGLIYEAGFLVRFCLKKNTAISFVVDIVFVLLCAAVILPAYIGVGLEARFYTFIGIAVGFLFERVSGGFLIAKIADKVYNMVTRLGKRLVALPIFNKSPMRKKRSPWTKKQSETQKS